VGQTKLVQFLILFQNYIVILKNKSDPTG